MRPSPLLLALSLAIPLLACAADDGFRTRLAQGCRSEPECAQLAAQADARAGTCPSTANPNVVIHLRLDLASSAPPCDEVEEDRRVAHGYLDGFTQERERQAAWAAQQEAAAVLSRTIQSATPSHRCFEIASNRKTEASLIVHSSRSICTIGA